MTAVNSSNTFVCFPTEGGGGRGGEGKEKKGEKVVSLI